MLTHSFFREEDLRPSFRLALVPRSSRGDPPRALVTTSLAVPTAAAAADTAPTPLPCPCWLPYGFSSTLAITLRTSAITARACGEVSVVSRLESQAIGFNRLPCEREGERTCVVEPALGAPEVDRAAGRDPRQASFWDLDG